MSRQSWQVLDGPLEGETFALDAEDGAEVSLQLGDGKVAVYFAKRAREYPQPNRLLYIGLEPPGGPRKR